MFNCGLKGSFRNHVHNHMAALGTQLVETRLSQPLIGGDPFEGSVADPQHVLPTWGENGRGNIGQCSGVGIALGGDIDAAASGFGDC